MTTAEIAARLTGEPLMTKYTGGRERPSRDEVARLAHDLYEARGRRDGHDVDDWLAAERALARRGRRARQ